MHTILKLQNDKGFLLIESILSIAIIAIGLFTVMSLATVVIKGNAQSKNATAAITLAQDKLEAFRGVGYDNITGTSSAYNDYYLQTLVQNNVPGVNMKTVTVDVYWSPGTTTSNHKVRLETIFTK